VHSRGSNGIGGFRLQGNIPKGFKGDLGPVDGDLDMGKSEIGASNTSTKALTQENVWNVTKQSTTNESSDEIRRFMAPKGSPWFTLKCKYASFSGGRGHD
jgi:hypothetical protein